jgi:type II secretory pathway component PulM
MMRLWQRLSKRERVLVALGFLILLVVLARYFLIAPFLERRQWVTSQLEIQPQLLRKNLLYVSRKAEIASALEKAQGGLKKLESTLLSGDTPSVNASVLQEVMREIAAKEAIRIVTTRVLSPERTGSLLRIPVQVDVEGEIGRLVNLMKEIESHSKLLVVSEINIRSPFSGGTRQRRKVVQKTRGLRANLVISGFSRSPAADASDSGT